jgi:hypothetical protein
VNIISYTKGRTRRKEYLEHTGKLKHLQNLVGESQGRILFGESRGQVMLKWIIKKCINVQVHNLSYSAISACSVMSECSEYFSKTLSSMTGVNPLSV